MAEKRFIGIKECSNYLDIKVSTLYRWTHERSVPYYKFGKIVKFDLKEIDVWVKKKKVKLLEKWWKNE